MGRMNESHPPEADKTEGGKSAVVKSGKDPMAQTNIPSGKVHVLAENCRFDMRWVCATFK